MTEKTYLPHIKYSLPKDVFTYQTSFYPVALEGWRRGLKLKYYNNKRGAGAPRNITYSLSDGENEYKFLCARGSKTTPEAIQKAKNKAITYEHLRNTGVPIIESKVFNYKETTIEEMCNYGEAIGYPLVIKPTSMGGGKGVVPHIDSQSMLKASLLKLKNDLKLRRVIIEKYFEGGVDYRFYVIKDKVIAVSKSYSSNVIGDGKTNIRELIKKRNEEIKNHVASRLKTIEIDENMKEYFKENDMSLDDVPKQGERVFVRKHGTYLKQRLNVECTDSIDPKFKKYAVDALASIPGLPTGSVDMIINEDKNKGIINEINDKGEISMHIFPFEGKAIDIPKHLIDYYFPGSKKINDDFYFEYKPVKDVFLSGYADELTLPMYPSGKYHKMTLKVEGERFGPIYLKKLKRMAAKLYLKGYIKSTSKDNFEAYIIGKKNNLNSFEDFVYNSGNDRSKVNHVQPSVIEEFNGIASISFEVIQE